jgi:AcrR family transcriptional regulator
MYVKHRTTPDHGAQTKARLIAVGRELFASQGYAGVALTEVCDRAGVTRGALYHHFPDKDGLFRAVCEEVAGGVSQRVIAAAAGEPDASSRLQTGCRAFLDACADSEVQQVLLADAPSVLGWEAFREIDGRHGLGLLKGALQAAMEEGTVQPGSVDMLAHVLVGALNEAAMLIGASGGSERARTDAVAAIDRLLAGIAGARAVKSV